MTVVQPVAIVEVPAPGVSEAAPAVVQSNSETPGLAVKKPARKRARRVKVVKVMGVRAERGTSQLN